ncbi:hypothetical protein BGZ73_005949 [Actinomortierella ambigua]|nr:hypothetical protein BGZ73_005949 [Actinomortierella ambigua]
MTMNDNPNSTNPETKNYFTFGTDSALAISECDNGSTTSNLGSGAAVGTISDNMNGHEIEPSYDPPHLDPDYTLSLLPPLAPSAISSTMATATLETDAQHPLATASTENSMVMPLGQATSSQPILHSGIWNSNGSHPGPQEVLWPQPTKKIRDKEASVWSSCPQPCNDHHGNSQQCKARDDSANMDQHQQAPQLQAARKPSFYHKQDHLGKLEVPEIISCIFEFLDKPSLASASRVSRTWRRYSMPLMWRHVADRNWRHRTFHSLISSKANWVRTLHCEGSTDYDRLLACNMACLSSISFRGSYDSIDTKLAIIQNTHKTLSSLSLSGVATTLSTDVAQVIQGLKRLSVLKITRTSITGSFVRMLLDGCPGLEFLSLRGITLQTTPTTDDTHPQLRTPDMSHPISRILYLNLRNVDISDDDLVYIAEACPELRELSIAGNSSLANFKNVAKTLHQSCRHLYALDLGSCMELTEDHFTALWTMLGPQLKIVNLAGTKLDDKSLVLMARECQSLTRLDIQYCTTVSTQGLHEFLCTVSQTLQQLEASGVTIDPEQIDDREWVCSGLEVLVIHINLFDRQKICPAGPPKCVHEMSTSSSSTTTSSTSTTTSADTTPTSLSTSVLEDTGETSSPAMRRPTGGDSHLTHKTSLLRLDEDVIMESPPAEAVPKSEIICGSSCSAPSPTNSADNDINTPSRGQTRPREDEHPQKETNATMTDPIQQDGTLAIAATEATNAAALTKMRRHRHHPIQRLTKLHYLGLMGTGAGRLVESSVGDFIDAFGQVDHLDLSGLSQAFRQQDLTWLIKSLPSLYQVDAEHYHISDDLRKWCRKEFPEIAIHRKGR